MITLFASMAAFACSSTPGPTVFAVQSSAASDGGVQVYLSGTTPDNLVFTRLSEDGSVTPLDVELDPLCTWEQTCLLTVIPDGVPGDLVQAHFQSDYAANAYQGEDLLISVPIVDLPAPPLTESAPPVLSVNQVTELPSDGAACIFGDQLQLEATIDFGDETPASVLILDEGSYGGFLTYNVQPTSEVRISLPGFADRCVSVARIFDDGSVGEASEVVCTADLTQDPLDEAPATDTKDNTGCSSASAPVSLGAFIGLMLLGARRRHG